MALGAAVGEQLSGWAVGTPGPIASGPLVPVRRPVPAAGPYDLVVRVEACGVCRTDLHLAEGDLAPHRPATIPGHEIVGRVIASAGPGCAGRADTAGTAGSGGRTCAPGRSTPAGTPTAASPMSRCSRRTT